MTATAIKIETEDASVETHIGHVALHHHGTLMEPAAGDQPTPTPMCLRRGAHDLGAVAPWDIGDARDPHHHAPQHGGMERERGLHRDDIRPAEMKIGDPIEMMIGETLVTGRL
jgi:hypothetical protein